MSRHRGQRPGSRGGIQVPREATIITRLDDIVEEGRRRSKPVTGKAVIKPDELGEMGEMGEMGSADVMAPPAEAPAPMAVSSKMLVFFAPKGGTGATTLAVNMGGVLTRMGRAALIVDMDLQLGAVPVTLNLKPERSIGEVMDEADRAGQGPVTSGLDRHPSGLTMLAQGDRIEELGKITPDRMPRLFDALVGSYEYVLVDGLRDFSDHAVATMDLAHKIVVVISQDVPAVRAGARALQIFQRLGYGADRVNILVNRYHKKAPVELGAIEAALGQAVDVAVGNDFRLVEMALNHGALLADFKPHAPLSRDVENMTRLLGEIDDGSSGSGGGFFARLFGRKG